MHTVTNQDEEMKIGSTSARAAALGTLLVLAGGCAASTDPPMPSRPTISAPPSPVETGPSGVGLLAPDPEASLTAPFLIATNEGIFAIAVDGAVEEVFSEPAAMVVDDTRGGVLFQEVRGRWAGLESPGGSTAIRWIEQGSGTAVDLMALEEGQFLELHDALEIGGDLAVYFTRSVGSTPEDMEDLLIRLDPVAGTEAEVRQVGGWEWGSDPISVTPSLIGATSTASVSRTFEFFDHEGAPVEVSGNPLNGPVGDCSSCPDLAELSAGASTLAFVELDPDDDGFLIIPELVLVEAESGNELVRLRLDRPDQGWVPASLDLGDGVVLMNRFVSGETGSEFDRPWVIDLRGEDPVIWEAALAGHARLLRSPPGIP